MYIHQGGQILAAAWKADTQPVGKGGERERLRKQEDRT
jgi:hypothetical protein